MRSYIGISFRFMSGSNERTYLTAVIWYPSGLRRLGYFYPSVRWPNAESRTTVLSIAASLAVSVALTYVVVMATMISATSIRPLAALAPLPAFNFTEGN